MSTKSENESATGGEAAQHTVGLDAADLRAVATEIQRRESGTMLGPASTRRVFKCPYCRANQGLVSVRPAALAEGLARQAETGEDALPADLGLPSDQRIITFGAGGIGQRPCPHMVGFWLELHVERYVDGQVLGRSTETDWSHPSFRESDAHGPIDDLHVHLWGNLTDPGLAEWSPPEPYLIQREHWTLVVSGSDWRVSALGWYIAAADPPSFLVSLRESEQRLQTFWSNEQ